MHHPQTAHDPPARPHPQRTGGPIDAEPNPIELEALEVGDILWRPIFTGQGVLLLTAGALVTESVIENLKAFEAEGLYEAQSSEQLRRSLGIDGWGVAQVKRLRPGSDPADETKELHFEFGPLELDDPAEQLRARAQLLKSADEIIVRHRRVWPVIRTTVRPLRRRFGLELSGGVGWPTGDDLDELRSKLIDGFRPTFARLAAGMGATLDELVPVVDALLEYYDRFPDRFAQLLYHPGFDGSDLPAHALLTAGCAVAIASRLAWARDDIRLTGVTALVMDAGMVMVPRASRCSVDPLDAFGYSRVDRHLAHTVALIEPGDLPAIVSLAAYQHHERLDASGYPHRAPGHEVCSIARVVSVADAYVASVSPRPFRPAHRPYEALEEIILLASKGVLDRKAVRALMEVTGLFPVGGYVRLSTGESARVIGVDPERPDRPDVFTVDTTRKRLLRLTEQPAFGGVSIVEPIDPPLSVRTRRIA